MEDTTLHPTFEENIYSEEEIQQISELMETIMAIRQRLFSEGVDVDALIKELQERDNLIE